MIQTMERQGRFVMALGLAKNRGVDEAGVAEVHRVYGDYLYGKGDGDGAMAQYVQTVGFVRPSYVIRKFLDAQRILNLVTYLQVLHSRGLANADHTTLLLNTYTKLKDVERLDQFIKTEVQRPPTSAEGPDATPSAPALPFDLDTAIRVCRQAGYFEHAAYLAKKYTRHEEYLRIQVEDAQNYAEALEYLRGMGGEATEGNMARYGRALLEHLPDQTTNLLVELCSGTFQAPKQQLKVDIEGALNLPAGPRTGLEPPPSALSSREREKEKEKGKESKKREEILSPSSLSQPYSQTSSTMTSVVPSPARAPSPPPPPAPPSPRPFFAHFVAHPKQFVLFLESVAERRWGQKVSSTGVVTIIPPNALYKLESELPEQTAVWNTLLELYLTATNDKTKAIAVLRSGGDTIVGSTDPKLPFDLMHALILCSTYQFTDGLVLLWEQMGMYEDVLRFWMERAKDPGMFSSPSSGMDPEIESKKASQRVLIHLEQYGPTHPHLYELVLRFLTSTPTLLHRHSGDVTKILGIIDQRKIMPPLGVVQVLSRNGVASVGLVKDWLVARIGESRADVESDRRLIESYRKETKEKVQEIAELSDPEHPRVFHVTRCSTCGNPLDLPTIHFMCKHSYHQKCLPDQDIECPICARQHSVIREIRRTNERLADAHGVFTTNVAQNGFEAVAAAFGRGILNGRVVEEGPPVPVVI
ncbi:hypothetical protein FS749_010714 [Ceratobasidium sp. UAMH 11750]|nr:hypothetical protein FS749_010714 [Ceratobasidium sp. UAMH 11750]